MSKSAMNSFIAGVNERRADARPKCPKCGHPKRENCDGAGWLEPIGPCADGSYITSRPCSNDNPRFDG